MNLREVYLNLQDAKEPKLNLSSINIDQNIIKNSKNYNKYVINISETEIKLHENFLKKELKKNYY